MKTCFKCGHTPRWGSGLSPYGALWACASRRECQRRQEALTGAGAGASR